MEKFLCILGASVLVLMTASIGGCMYASKQQDQNRVAQLISAIETTNDPHLRDELTDQLYVLEINAGSGPNGYVDHQQLHEQMIVRQILRAMGQHPTPLQEAK